MKRKYSKSDYDEFCKHVKRDIIEFENIPRADDEEDVIFIDTVVIDKDSFRSEAAVTKTLASLFMRTVAKTPILVEFRCFPDECLWPAIIACLPQSGFYVNGEEMVAKVDDFVRNLPFVDDLIRIHVANTATAIFQPVVKEGSIPVFATRDDIPPYVQTIVEQMPNRNNHVNKRVDPSKIYATNIMIPSIFIDLIDSLRGITFEESKTIPPFILSNPFFYREFDYDGVRELKDIDDECRNTLDFIGYVISRCVVLAYLHMPEVDLEGCPKLLVMTWINACLGRYSGNEPSASRFGMEIDMPPRGPTMADDSSIIAWMINELDDFTRQVATNYVTKPLLEMLFSSPDDTACGVSGFDEVFATERAIMEFVGDCLAPASSLIACGIVRNVSGLAAGLAKGQMLHGMSEVFCKAYDDGNRKDPLFVRLFEIIPPSMFPKPDHVTAAIEKLVLETAPVDDLREFSSSVRRLFGQVKTKMIAGLLLRQVVELRPDVILSTPDATTLPFVVQGESFILPYHSLTSSRNVSGISEIANVHLAAFAVSQTPAYSSGEYEFVDLPPHVFLYNQGVRQHDYLYFFESWNNLAPEKGPTIFTAIINLSSRNMLFRKEYAGRAVYSATGSDPRGFSRHKTDPTAPAVSILPGHMYMYERVPCKRDRSTRPHTFQARLSMIEDVFDEHFIACEDEQPHVTTEGILYVQTSIAVYRKDSLDEKTREALYTQMLMSENGGLSQSSLYHGKQASTTGNDGFVDIDKKPKRYPFPQLYNQLTNSHRGDTSPRFVGNYMLQRPEICRWFYQEVAIVRNDGAASKDERVKVIIPKNGKAYDLQRYAFDLQIQQMSFKQLYTSGEYKRSFRRTDNNSTFTTRAELEASNISPEKFTRIYPSIIPSVANLRTLPGISSHRDKYIISCSKK